MSVLPFPSVQRPAEPAHEPKLREVVGDVLREERHDQQRTLTDVAEQAAVSVAYLSEIERGRKDVSSEVLRSVCDALEVPLPVILERTAHRLRGTNAQVRALALAA
ncbi:MAG TPA: helix-turn-helix domain-containing protein [Ilumatobacter sp.]|nr:helix-turn-helix domain-containing protein [Ilumatobacter sp.]